MELTTTGASSSISNTTRGDDSEIKLDTHGLRGKIALASVGVDSPVELTTTGAKAHITAHASAADSEARFIGAAGIQIASGPGSRIKIQGGNASSEVWLQRGGELPDGTPLAPGRSSPRRILKCIQDITP